MSVCYVTVVTQVGPLVADFVAREMLVMFAEGAPEELHEFSVLHTPEQVFEEVGPGDVVSIGSRLLTVTAVGAVANANLRSLGHAVFKCNGKPSAELPGDICLQGGLVVPDLRMSIRIERGS